MEVVCGFPTNKRSVKNANPMPMMNYIFGPVKEGKVHEQTGSRARPTESQGGR